MYVEFMKNFPLADSNEQMAVRLILALWAKNVWLLLSRHDVRRVHENIFSPMKQSFRPPEPKNVWFLLSRHNWSGSWKIFISPILEQMAVRVISASWAQKRLIPTF